MHLVCHIEMHSESSLPDQPASWILIGVGWGVFKSNFTTFLVAVKEMQTYNLPPLPSLNVLPKQTCGPFFKILREIEELAVAQIDAIHCLSSPKLT